LGGEGLGRSKFAKSEHFDRATTAHIGLQNYRGTGVWFCKLKIREIDPEQWAGSRGRTFISSA
jgi:hypothetical protein